MEGVMVGGGVREEAGHVKGRYADKASTLRLGGGVRVRVIRRIFEGNNHDSVHTNWGECEEYRAVKVGMREDDEFGAKRVGP